MFAFIKKSLGKLDILILLAAIFIFTRLDYSNLSTSDIVYLVTFAIWILLLAVRIYILYKNEDDRK